MTFLGRWFFPRFLRNSRGSSCRPCALQIPISNGGLRTGGMGGRRGVIGVVGCGDGAREHANLAMEKVALDAC